MNITQEGEDQYQIRQEQQNIKYMISGEQPKVLLTQDEDGNLKLDETLAESSLMMSPFSQYFTWQTTIVTEIVEERDDYVKFKTENSNYELWKLS